MHGGRVISFAKSLKRLALDLGWDGKKDERGRRLLQGLGQTLRAYDPDFWIKKADFNPVKVDTPVFIDDLRFQNELEYLKRHAFHIVYLKPFGFSMNEKWREDASENDIKPEDCHTVLASHKGNLEDLQAAIDTLVERLTTPLP